MKACVLGENGVQSRDLSDAQCSALRDQGYRPYILIQNPEGDAPERGSLWAQHPPTVGMLFEAAQQLFDMSRGKVTWLRDEQEPG